MNDRLVLSSTFFNISGGRREDKADTFRALTSLQTHAGGEAGLYAVSEASAPGPMGVRARRLVIEVLEGEYASRFDLAPGPRLRAAVTTAHERLKSEFSGHVRVGLTALAAEGASLYLVQVPPAQAYVFHDGDLHSVTPDASTASVPFARALGSTDVPTTSLFRDEIQSGDTVVLLSTWFAQELTGEDLRRAFSVGNGPEEITSVLLDQCRKLEPKEVSCVALQAVPYDESVQGDEDALKPSGTPTVWDHVDETAASLSYVWGRAKEELTPPGLRNASSAGSRTGKSPSKLAPAAAATLAATELSGVEPPLTAATPRPETVDTADQPLPDHGTEELPIVPDLPSESDAREKELNDVNTFIQTGMSSDPVTPPIQNFPDMNVAPERINPATAGQPGSRTNRFGSAIRPQSGTGPSEKAYAARSLRPRRSRIDLSSIPRTMYLWAAVPIILVGLVIYLSTGGGGKSSPPPPDYVAQAQAEADKALSTGDIHIQRAVFRQAQADLAKAKSAGVSSQQIAAASAHIQKVTDQVWRISRFTLATGGPDSVTQVASFAHTFGDKNQIVGRSQLTSGGSALFVLNRQRRQLVAIPDPSSSKVVPVAKDGDLIGTAVPTRWGPPTTATGLAGSNTALTLDTQFRLLISTLGQPGVLGTLTPPASPTHIVASGTYVDSDYYVLDTDSNQIYKYCCIDTTDGFVASPEPWITPSPKAGLLAHAVSMAIDGNIWVGTHGGRVLKFTAGKQATFVKHTPLPLNHLNQVYTTASAHRIFLVDSREGRIVVLGKLNGYYVQTVILPRSLWPLLGQMTTSADGRTLYFVSGSSVYKLQVPKVAKAMTPPAASPTATPIATTTATVPATTTGTPTT